MPRLSQQVLRRLDKTFAAFFRRVKAGEKPGFPKVQVVSNVFRSVEYRHGDGLQAEGGHALRPFTQGTFPIRLHREVPKGCLKHVVISRKARQTAGSSRFKGGRWTGRP